MSIPREQLVMTEGQQLRIPWNPLGTECPFCKLVRSYKKKDSWEEHLDVCNPAGPRYLCNYPGCSFKHAKRREVQRHIYRSHEHKFECKKCFRSFGSDGDLRNHPCTHGRSSITPARGRKGENVGSPSDPRTRDSPASEDNMTTDHGPESELPQRFNASPELSRHRSDPSRASNTPTYGSTIDDAAEQPSHTGKGKGRAIHPVTTLQVSRSDIPTNAGSAPKKCRICEETHDRRKACKDPVSREQAEERSRRVDEVRRKIFRLNLAIFDRTATSSKKARWWGKSHNREWGE